MALDLSEAGARLLTTDPLEAGEKVVLELHGLQYRQPLSGEGYVVWSYPVSQHGYAVGIRFEDRLDGDVIENLTIRSSWLDY
jgi:hypothetical protein